MPQQMYVYSIPDRRMTWSDMFCAARETFTTSNPTRPVDAFLLEGSHVEYGSNPGRVGAVTFVTLVPFVPLVLLGMDTLRDS